MSTRRDFDCGCAWVQAGGNWWHVVGCPLHHMDMLPKLPVEAADYDARCYHPCRNDPLHSPARCGPCHLIWPSRPPGLTLLEASDVMNRRLADAAEAGLSVREAVAAWARGEEQP